MAFASALSSLFDMFWLHLWELVLVVADTFVQNVTFIFLIDHHRCVLTLFVVILFAVARSLTEGEAGALHTQNTSGRKIDAVRVFDA